MKRQVVLDTETTGLTTEAGHRLIEIGGVELINRRLTGRHFHRYVNPEREIDAGAYQVHGISNAFLADKPLFADIVSELLDFVNQAELIIHNAKFDIGFLNYEFSLLKHNQPGKITDYCKIIDTLSLAREYHPGQRHSLDALCKRYNIDNSQRELHGALLDAQLLARVYLAMTGGQSSLFDQAPAFTTDAPQQTVAITAPAVPITVLTATAEEVRAHEDYLHAMQQKQQRCVWLEHELWRGTLSATSSG